MKMIKLKLPIILLSISILSLGCASHLHNPGDQKLALKAQEQLNQLIQEQNTVFDAMLTNLAQMSEFELQIYEEMRKKETEIRARNVLRMKWGQLNAALAAREGQETGEEPGESSGNGATVSLLSELSDTVDRIRSNIYGELKISRDAMAQEKEKLELARKELERAKSVLTNWNRRVAVLEKLIAVTPNIEIAISQVHDSDEFKSKAEDIAKAVKTEIGKASVTFETADGEKKTVDLEGELTKMFDVDLLLNNGDPDTSKILRGVRAFINPEAPGLVLTIAALAKDLAENERTRTMSHIRSLEKRLDVANRSAHLLKIADEMAEEARNFIQNSKFFDHEKGVMEDLKDFAKDKKKPLSDAMFAIQAYVNIAGPIAGRIANADREVAYLTHHDSIEISRINTASHEILAARGIEGLVAYHSGGVKPEEIAEITYRAAQLVILGIIASGVN